MDARGCITETRRVSGFNRIVLRAQHENELILAQGDREGLTIEGPANFVHRIDAEVRQGTLFIGTGGGWRDRVSDALTTSLNRPRLRYRVTVRELCGLEITAMASVRAAAIRARDLVLKFRGLGQMRIDSLVADRLEAHLLGGARIELAGQVGQQSVAVGGPGQFVAPGLQSSAARVSVGGIGAATIWATRDLDVTVRGPGRVSYYGAPRVRKSIAPMGSLVSLGPPSQN